MRKQTPRRVMFECAALEARRLLCAGVQGEFDYARLGGDPGRPASSAAVGPESIDQLTVPAFSSLPSASRKLYLDFNGHPTIEGWLGWAVGGEDAGPTPAYDIDGDNDSFNFQELDNIELIWKGVSEKFSPFNVDVTTIKPSTINGARVVIGGDGAWHGSGGGVGHTGGWGEEGFLDVKGANVAFVWDGQGSGRSDPGYIVEAISHEAGHTLGLHHQSRNPFTDGNGDIISGNEYLAGFIMGNGNAGATPGRWAHTSLTGPGGVSSDRDSDNIVSRGSQDDLAVITRLLPSPPFPAGVPHNGFTFRVDDAGGTTATAANLPILSNNGILEGATTGVIETMPDVDVYRIVHGGGSLDIEVLAAQFRRMLDPNLALLNSGGGVIQSSSANNGSDRVGERIQFNQLNAGTYFLRIAGSGAYGDIGQYRLNVRAGTPMASNDTLGTATLLGAFGRTDAGNIALGFAGTANVSDGLASTDSVDFFKIVAPARAKRVFARLSGLTTTAGLAIIEDRNGDGLVGATEAILTTPPGTGVQQLGHGSAVGGKTYFVRVTRGSGAPNGNYQLRITADAAPESLPPTTASATFDPQPLRGGKLVYESIDATIPDTTDLYRVTAASAGLFSFFMNQQDFTGDLRLDVGADANNNGTLEAAEILGSSAVVGGSGEAVQNMAVTQGQQLLVRVSQQTNTSDNYILQAVADYATGGNLTGALTSATNMTGSSAASIREYLGSAGDVFDTYRINPPAGPLTARVTALELGAGHRLEIIRDADGDGVVSHGEIVASGFNTQLTVTVPTPGLFPPPYYLRVASVISGGEFPSIGNYNLTFITAGATTNQTFAAPQQITVLSTPRTANAYLAFDPADASLTDTEDFFQFTLGSRTRFDVSSSDPLIGVQVGRLNAGIFQRISGVGTFQGTTSSLSVNLDPGTYLLRAYLPVEERQEDPSGGNFTLTFNTAAIIDNSPPLVTAAEFQYEIKPVGVIFDVDQDVQGSIDASDVMIRNLASSATFPAGQTFYDAAAHKIGYAVAAGTLPDGNYRATLLAGSVRDASANPLAADSAFDFFVLAGDANRDRRVDIADFSVVATRFNLPGTFSQGDFNYDRVTNLGDFSILASKFNTTLPDAVHPSFAAAASERQRAMAWPERRPGLFSELDAVAAAGA